MSSGREGSTYSRGAAKTSPDASSIAAIASVAATFNAISSERNRFNALIRISRGAWTSGTGFDLARVGNAWVLATRTAVYSPESELVSAKLEVKT